MTNNEPLVSVGAVIHWCAVPYDVLWCKPKAVPGDSASFTLTDVTCEACITAWRDHQAVALADVESVDQQLPARGGLE